MRGRIIGNISNLYTLESLEEENKIFQCNARKKIKLSEENIPVVGDIVEFDDENLSIEKINKRKNYLKRPKIANITQIICVISAKHPKPDLLLLDKQLAYASFLGIKACIIINKNDLDSTVQKKIQQIYATTNYKLIKTEAKESKGIEEVRKILKNNISVFSGNSGVGKSSLINDIFDEDKTKEGIISERNKRGKNTTTDINLYKLDKETYIADTPGFSTFNIEEILYKDLDKYFTEFEQFIKNCEFVGCTHIKETNCGIKEALKNHEISDSRYNNYVKIYEFLKDKQNRKGINNRRN